MRFIKKLGLKPRPSRTALQYSNLTTNTGALLCHQNYIDIKKCRFAALFNIYMYRYQ